MIPNQNVRIKLSLYTPSGVKMMSWA